MLLGAVLLWALNVTVTKYMLEHGWLPLAYGAIRYFAAIAIFWIYTWWRERSFRIAREDWRYVGIAAATIFVNQLCFVYSLEFAHASTVSLLFGTCPMFVGLISIVFLRAHLERSFWIGAALTVRRRRADRGGAGGGLVSGWKGDLLAIMLAITWAAYTLAIAPLMRRYSPYRISAVVLAIGWAPLALVSIPQIARQDFSFSGAVWLGFVVRRDRAALPHEHPLVHGRRPGRRRARVDLQQHAAVLRCPLRAADPLGVDPRARDRRRLAHLRGHRLRAGRGVAIPASVPTVD